MTLIFINSRYPDTTETREFAYHHTAVSWLLLSSFLPTSEDPDLYVNVYTGATARLTRI